MTMPEDSFGNGDSWSCQRWKDVRCKPFKKHADLDNTIPLMHLNIVGL